MEGKVDSVIQQSQKYSGFGKTVKYLSKVIDPLSTYPVTFSCAMLVAMMFLTFFDVAGRYVLNKPILGSFEITEFMMFLLTCFGLAYTAFRRSHIRVDFIFSYLSRRTALGFDIMAYGVSAIFYALVAWQSWIAAFRAMASKSTSSLLFIPVYPLIFMLVIGAGLVCLVFLRDFLNSIEEIKKIWRRF